MARIDCITIEGDDARTFAQAQFASNVDHLAPGRWQWSAWLTARGQVRMLLHLADPGNGRLLAVLRGGDARASLASLARYRLRARVTLGLQTLDATAGPPLDAGTVKADGGDVILGYGARSLRLCRRSGAVDQDARDEWRLADICAGWPLLPAVPEPHFLPPALGLGHLGAVDVGKGCYPGQEIAARLHFRGGYKRGLFHVRGAAALPLGEAGVGAGATIWVLDAVNRPDGTDALVVATTDNIIQINILNNIYNVIKKFTA